MKKVFLALLLILYSHTSFAAPSISSIAGTPEDGESITITGLNFGAHADNHAGKPQLCKIWEDLDVDGKTDGDFSQNYGPERISDPSDNRTNSAWCARSFRWVNVHTWNTVGGNPAICPGDVCTDKLDMWNIEALTGVPQSTVFISGWFMVPSGWETAWIAEFNCGGADIPQTKMLMLSPIDNAPKTYFNPSNLKSGFPPQKSWLEDGVLAVSEGRYTDFSPEGEWHRWDIYADVIDGAAGGDVKFWVDGKLLRDTTYSDVLGCPGAQCPEDFSKLVWLGLMKHSGCGDTNIYYIYVDDMFADYTRARVEISENSTWNDNSQIHKEIQIATAWAAGEITITFNTGAFEPTNLVYLYVIDDNGSVNLNGYPITIGGDITPPTLLSATITTIANEEILSLDYDEPVYQGGAYSNNHSNLDASIVGVDIGVVNTAGNGTTTHTYTINDRITIDDVVDYDFSGIVDSLKDAASNNLIAILNFAVVNNSSYVIIPPIVSDTFYLNDALVTGANDGTSWADAWQSFAAVNQVTINTALAVGHVKLCLKRAVTHYGQAVLTGIIATDIDHIFVIGTDDITPDTGANPIWDGDNTCITYEGQSYIYLENIDFMGNTGSALVRIATTALAGSHNIILKNCLFTGSADAGVLLVSRYQDHLYSISDILFIDCEASYNASTGFSITGYVDIHDVNTSGLHAHHNNTDRIERQNVSAIVLPENIIGDGPGVDPDWTKVTNDPVYYITPGMNVANPTLMDEVYRIWDQTDEEELFENASATCDATDCDLGINEWIWNPGTEILYVRSGEDPTDIGENIRIHYGKVYNIHHDKLNSHHAIDTVAGADGVGCFFDWGVETSSLTNSNIYLNAGYGVVSKATTGGILIANNIIDGNDTANTISGINVYVNVGSDDVDIINNTIDCIGGYGIGYVRTSTGTVENNIILNASITGLINDTPASIVLSDYNYYNSNIIDELGVVAGGNSFFNMPDPKFIDVANRNYHLDSYSPCIDIGKLGLRNTDIDGDSIYFGGGPEVGVDETHFSKAGTANWNLRRFGILPWGINR